MSLGRGCVAFLDAVLRERRELIEEGVIAAGFDLGGEILDLPDMGTTVRSEATCPCMKMTDKSTQFQPGANSEGERLRKKALHMRQYRHGIHMLKRAVSKLGSRAIDKRYRIGRALVQWQRELIADMGGEDNISTQ